MSLLFRRSRVAAGTTGVLGILLAAVLLTASPAAAHDELADSDPAAGDSLASAPAEITLTYSADILEMGAEVIVVDAEGTDWVEGTPLVEGQVVTATVGADMPVAGYEVRWRVVSSDGHPISGVIPFTVGDAEPLPATVDSSAEPGEETTTDAPVDAPVDAQAENESALRILLIALVGAFVAIGAFIVIALLVRRRRAGKDS